MTMDKVERYINDYTRNCSNEQEVDLEKEFDKYTQPITAQDIKDEPFTQLFACAQHFYELGMRVNNPITAADRGTAEEIILNLKRVEQDYCINLTKEMKWLRNIVKKGE